MNKNKDYLITEKPSRALFAFALPMIIGNLFQQAYTIVDSAIVGHYVGETALAAVGASYALTSIFICVAIGGGIGASVIISQHFGGHAYSRMKTSIRTAMLSFLLISLLLGGIGLCFSRQIMEALNTPADAMDIAVIYLNIYFYGLPFLFMYNILSSMFNALGESRIPLYLLIFSSVLNIFLDLYMVATLHLGVAGAAYATFIAQGISAVCSFLIFLHTLRRLDGKAETWFSKAEFSSMSRIALPSILQQSTVSIGMMLVQSVVNGFGTQILAGFSAGMRIESLCVVPMAAIGNGIMLHGGLRAYVATFFVFSDYVKPMARLSALMGVPLTFVLTHDSIGVGEDGPTHEPIEQLAMLRAMPNLRVFRPCDATETSAAWLTAASSEKTPTALVLTRQNLAPITGSSREALKGGYVIDDCEGTPEVILIASGSEVELAVKAKAELEAEGTKVRVVSMPCMELFEEQSAEYREVVLPKAVRKRVAIEALSDFGWGKYVGLDGAYVCMKSFGASAPAAKLFEKFGFTVENVVNTVKAL